MAKCGVTNVAGGGGIGSDELSVTKEYILSGKTYVGADTDDEIGTGIMPNNGATANQSLNAGGSFLVKNGYHAQGFTVIANSLASQTPATATDNRVMSGDTYWRNGVKGTGTMSVQSILSFSVAPYTASQMVFTWKNPAMGPFSGVIIVGKTGGYPTSITDGTRYYKGFGNNASANGTSNVVIGGFSTNITYYFRAFGYTTLNNAEWVNSTSLIANTIIRLTTLTFTSSQTWVAPPGINEIQVFVVGGGGAGGKSTLTYLGDPSGSGGGGGYTKTETISVTPGQQIPVIIGAGGESVGMTGGNGGDTSFGSVIALGGKGGSENSWSYNRGEGGSGGGGAGIRWSTWNRDVVIYAGNGGSDGGDGGESSSQTRTNGEIVARGQVGATGQHTTTRAFGEAGNTIYSGGGGGGGGMMPNSNSQANDYFPGGAGGAGGGGRGGENQYNISNATPNTGGGGGGSTGKVNSGATRPAGNGGSGICIIRYLG